MEPLFGNCSCTHYPITRILGETNMMGCITLDFLLASFALRDTVIS